MYGSLGGGYEFTREEAVKPMTTVQDCVSTSVSATNLVFQA